MIRRSSDRRASTAARTFLAISCGETNSLPLKWPHRFGAVPYIGDINMDLRHLRYFIAVSEELSFTRAAERVGIAQPPFSQQIQALEREIGVRLIERTPRRVALTEAGIVFAERARQILARIADAVTVTQQVGRGIFGHVRVGFSESGCFH